MTTPHPSEEGLLHELKEKMLRQRVEQHLVNGFIFYTQVWLQVYQDSLLARQNGTGRTKRLIAPLKKREQLSETAQALNTLLTLPTEFLLSIFPIRLLPPDAARTFAQILKPWLGMKEYLLRSEADQCVPSTGRPEKAEEKKIVRFFAWQWEEVLGLKASKHEDTIFYFFIAFVVFRSLGLTQPDYRRLIASALEEGPHPDPWHADMFGD